MSLVDTHCHIDLYPDYQQVVKRVEAKQIYTVAVTTAPSVYRQSNSLTKDTKFLRTALGFHPELVAQRAYEIDLFVELASDTKYIGEIGLDFVTTDEENRNIQKKVFEQIISHCASLKRKILTIHSRRAAMEVVDMIGDNYPNRVILHWYSGSKKALQKGLGYGFYFSVNSAMLLSENGLKIIREIPRDKLLTESDGPFVNTQGRAADPLDMQKVVQGLSELHQMPYQEMEDIIFTNFRQLLKTTE
ncbi:MAG: TatD family hydrolase [Anaerolineales bacterium]|nr:TatD family hydrolase [Anaerolineales bacterium]